MSVIKVDNFGGIIPKIGSSALPDGGASYAHDVDIVGGVLRTLDGGGTLQNNSGIGELSALDVSSDDIGKPNAPTVTRLRFLDPSIISISYRVWAILTPDDGSIQQWGWLSGYIGGSTGETLSFKFTEQGLRITGQMEPAGNSFPLTPPNSEPFNRFYTTIPGVVKIIGPTYTFQLAGDTERGGPSALVNTNPTPHFGDPEIPVAKIPLEFMAGTSYGMQSPIIYGAFEVVDVDGPKWDEEYSILNTPQDFYFPYNGVFPEVTFNVNLNYVNPKRQYFYYCQTATKEDGAIEGVPSDITSEKMLYPGMYNRITLASSGNTDYNLYRSGTGGDDFTLLNFGDTADNQTHYIDWGRPSSDIVIPPYGVFPGVGGSGGSPDDETGVLQTLLHPAKFGVHWSGQTLYFSDRYRLHAWPGDYTIPFPENIKGCIMSGSTILVFTSTRVYTVHGSNPDNMVAELLSDDKPVNSMAQVCRIDQMIYWTTDFGLCASNGGSVKLISETHYMGASDWPAANGALYASGNVLYADAGSTVLRIELDEDVIRSVTTLSASAVSYGASTATKYGSTRIVGATRTSS